MQTLQFNDLIKKIKEYQNYILLFLVLSGVIVGGFYGITYYKKSREEKAYRSLVLALEYFNAPIKEKDSKDQTDLSFLIKKEFKTETEKWEKVNIEFEKAYNRNASSGLAPMFLVYRSQALVNLGKIDDGIDVLRSAIDLFTQENMKDFFTVRLGLMMIDSKDKSKDNEGLKILTDLSLNTESSSHDRALYYLGEYYWHKKDFLMARNYWNRFLVKYGKGEKVISPLTPSVKEKLELIDSDIDSRLEL